MFVRRHLRSVLLAGTALTLATIAVPHRANAETATYDGAGATTANGNYNLNTNYDTGVAPSSAADTAVFNDTATVAKTTTITFATATNPLGTLSFTGTTAYTFNLANGQAFNPTVLSNATTANQTFNMAGTGSMTIGSVNNTGGITTFNTTGTGAAIITGAASIGTSTLTYTGNAASIGGAFTSAGGNLVLTGVTSVTSTIGSIAGTGTIAMGTNALSVGGAGSTTTYSGVVSGSGPLTITGGTLTLSGANTFSGTLGITGGGTLAGAVTGEDLGSSLIFNNGTIQAGGALTTANAIALTGNGAINSNGNAVALSGAITGAGGLTKVGTGNLTLSNAANTYSGGTSLVGGTVTIAANNAAGSGALAVGGGTTFIMNGFNQSVAGLSGSGTVTSTGGALTSTNTGVFTGTITSTAGLTKSTTGIEVLDGTSTFSSTNVSGGTLAIGDAANPGAILNSPSVTVQTGGALLGHGTIVGNLISAGTVAPGGTIGTLTVSGNYQATPASTLAIELNPTTSSQLAVSGTAGLAGTLAVTPDAGAYQTGMQYTILTAGGGVSGRFQNLTDSSSSVIFATSYLPNSVVLTAVNLNQAFVGQTQNESNAAGAVRSIVASGATGTGFVSGLAGIFGTMQLGQNGAQVADALGELRADAATISLANVSAFNNILTERMSERQGLTTTHMANSGLPGTFDVAMNDSDVPMFGPSDNGGLTISQPSVWVHGYGVLGEIGGESGYANYQTRTGGIVAGVDSLLTPGTLVGVALDYDHTDYNLSGDTDENNIDSYRVSLYGSTKLDPVPLTLDTSVGYAFNDYHNNSSLSEFNGNGFSQTSRHDGNTLTAEGGLSHAFTVPQKLVTGTLTLVPRAGVEYDNISQSDFTTTGAPVRALDIHTEGSTLNALRSTIGGKADLDLKTKDGTVITPEVRASYLHDFMDTNVSLAENFTGAGAAGFNIQGVRPGRDAALVGTGVTVSFSKNVSANISYDADVRDHELDNIIQAGAKYTW